MKALLTDLDTAERSRCGLGHGFDVVIGREQLQAGHACLGCFGCWVRSPGRCVIADGLEQMGALLGSAYELWVVSRNVHGEYSPLVKRGMDRTLPYLHPCFRVLDGTAGRELHHRMRYNGSARSGGAGTRLVEKIWMYGASTPAEQDCFLATARANQLNQDTDIRGVWFCDDARDCGDEDAAPNRWDASWGDATFPRGEAVRACWDVDAGDVRVDRVTPHAPRRIALICASPRGKESASLMLLDDLADALLAYDAASSVSGADTPPEFVRMRCTAAGKLTNADELTACDAIVLGYPLYVDALPSNLVWLLDQMEQGTAPRPAPGTPVYAISNLGFYEPEQIETSFAALACWCRTLDLAWQGGLAVGGGGMAPGLRDSPRMGGMRRAWSEATDRLIAALRCGLTVADAAERFGGTPDELEAARRGAILARCAIPRFAYRSVAEAGWHVGCRKAGTDLNAAPIYVPEA